MVTDYRYNYAGHRYYKHVSGGSWEYFGLDDGVRTGLFGQATPDPIWNILTPSGRVIGRNPYNGGPSYYVTDHLGSTRVVVGSSGSIQEAYDYYPFGLPMPGRSITGWSETPERFAGYYKDQGSYLYHAQARMYDPAIGRFMSVDPILLAMTPNELVAYDRAKHLSLSPYVYVRNNPLLYIDPDGYTDWDAVRSGALKVGFGVLMISGAFHSVAIGIAAAPKTGGTSASIAFKGSTLFALGGATIGAGISEMDAGFKTPDGLKADEFKSIEKIIAEGFGAGETAQELVELIVSVYTGGGPIKVGKMLIDGDIIKASVQAGKLSGDLRDVLRAYEEERIRKKEDEL